ncbi:hypothetical protein B1992_00690 [Pseudoxanthomonas broegbernensis]|uniref:EAL domain-containing protein n=1 Tax=Pseudoxanthomonas broegbernensis TaxID=83619 RepID=A0A7V8GPZ9_9GAMM|nr:EAL domain-containing protein [Pseudoxanthomonas broegbernensis]KAF1687988.1 hypothetical protein B1992_00690 [Pseudoxanthomonas broegbernensis]MBB6065004.1 diguanylate cyclase (GGDEF)-like protein [Pseudoxanthomonas broegbernensis]
MISANSAESTGTGAADGGHAALAEAAAALDRALPGAAVLALGWNDPALGVCTWLGPGAAAQAGLLRTALECAATEHAATEHGTAPPPELWVHAWRDVPGGACLALVAHAATLPGGDMRDAWLVTARAVLAPVLEAARLRSRLAALEKSQRALYEIADLAGSDVGVEPMLHRLHAIVASLMHAPECSIVQYDEACDTVRVLYQAGLTSAADADPARQWRREELQDDLVFALLRHGRAVRGPPERVRRDLGLAPDAAHGPDSQDWLGVPMRCGGRVCGAIVVRSPDRADCYGEEEGALLGYVVQHVLDPLGWRQAQVHLEQRVLERTLELEHANRELQEEVVERERAEKLQHALFRIAEMAMSSESLEQYYAKVHAAVDELIYARNFYIAMLSESQDEIEFVYSVDETGDHRPVRRLSNGLTEYVVRSREALLVDREGIDRLIAAGQVREFGQQAHSWLGVPLKRDGEVVGVITAQSYSPGIRFTADDQRLLAFIAHNIGNGLARQKAQERLKAAHAELERRVAERTAELEEANRQLVAQIGERLRAERQLTHQALHDTLTGLPNRAYLLDCLAAAIERARHGDGRAFAVLFMDLDRFKLVNDSIGHVAGDELLVEVGKRIVSVVRADDIVARLGGDEFAILARSPPGSDGSAGMRDLARRLLETLGSPLWVAGRELFPSASMGIALWHPRYRTGEELLRDADAAMYRAKNQGRGRHAVFDEAMREQAVRSLDLEADLRRAINRRQFLPYYQPIVRLDDGAVVGHEALLRWRHERRGILAPAAFISLGEESGLIEQVDWLLYEQVIADLAQGGEGYVSVNVSPLHFRSPDFAERLLGLLGAAGAAPDRLRVEITEVALLDDAPRTLRILDTLREHGVLVQLDDFGTGFSALSYLHRFPISGLKIDRSFVAGLGEEGGRQESLALLRAILALAGTLGIETVGEGVELEVQRRLLQALGCRYGQGFLLGRPQPQRVE